jgi:hypothetical protein
MRFPNQLLKEQCRQQLELNKVVGKQRQSL